MPLNQSLKSLFDQALRDYRTRCFWNCEPTFCEVGLDLVADRLRKHGNLKAWHLADQIEGERRRAA